MSNMKSNNTRGGKYPNYVSNSMQSNHHANGLKSGVKRSETAIHEKFTDLLARSCGQLVTATVSSGAKYRGLLASVDVGVNAENALSAVLVRPVAVSEPLIDEKSNVDKALPLKLVIQAKDLLDLEVSVPHSTQKNSEKQSPVSSVSSVESAASKPDPIVKPTEKLAPVHVARKSQPIQNRSKTSSPEPKAPSPNPPPAPTKGFKTDRDISKGYEFRERALQRWQPDDDSLDVTLEASSNDGGAWDQFKTNEEKFGVESTYDEHLYTTRVNTNAKDYMARLSRAEKLAKEIEGQSSNDRHVLEERGIKVDDSGLDEEDKYSGVLKDEPSTEAPVDNRGNELMAALRNASISNGAPPAEVKQGNYSTPRQRAAQYHNDPAIISSSASVNKPVNSTEIPKKVPANPLPPTAIPEKPPVSTQQEPQGESMRLNAESEFNALREFSVNFKVPHKIPNDLLPILAKDKMKQNEIMMKQKTDTGKPPANARAADVKEPAKPKDSKPEIKKDSKFKLNPKAAAFTPSKMPQMSPHLANASPRAQHQRPFSNSSGGSNINNSRRHNQISAADFFGGANKVPTAQSQKEKIAKFKVTFNPFLAAKRNHKDTNTRLVLEKAFVTPPTWDSTVDKSFEDLIDEQCSQDLNSSTSPPPAGAYMQSPIMAVPGAGPHFAAAGGHPGMQGMNKFFGSQAYMQNPMAAQYSQQYQMAMMYQPFQGMPPGQPQMMFAPPGVDPQFIPPGGYMMPQGFQSPTSGHMNMHNGSPYAGGGSHGQQNHQPYNSQTGRRYNHQNKRGGHGTPGERT